MLSGRLLDELLDPERLKPAKQTVIHEDHGPGYFDKWAFLFEGKEDCWQVRENEGAEKPRKKIIFCHGLANEEAPTDLEYQLIPSLIEHYPVFVWKGGGENFREPHAINSSQEFWHKRAKINSATKEKVEEELNKLGISSDDFIILDRENYEAFIKNLISKLGFGEEKQIPVKPQQALNLSNIPITDEETLNKLKHSVKSSQITFVETFAPNKKEQEIILKTFENLNYLLIKNMKITPDYFQNLENFLKSPIALILRGCVFNPELSFTPRKIKKLTLHQEYRLEHLIIDYSEIANEENSLEELELYKISELKEIEIHSNELKKIKLSECKNLKKLILDAPALEELEISWDLFNEIDLSNFPKLKTIKITKSTNAKQPTKIISEPDEIQILKHMEKNLADQETGKVLTTETLSQLEAINLQGILDPRSNFTDCKNLKDLNFQEKEFIKIDCANFPLLKNLSIGGFYLPKVANQEEPFSVENCENVEKLVLSNCQLNKKINSQSLKSLTGIVVMSCYDSQIDLTNSKDLKYVTLSYCNKLEKFVCSSDIEFLSINNTFGWAFNVKNYPKLKDFIYKGERIPSDFSEQDFSNLLFLETLTLITVKGLEQINLKNCLNLKSIKLVKISGELPKGLEFLPKLNRLEINNANIWELTPDFLKLLDLKQLEITSSQSLWSIALAPFSKVEKMIIFENKMLNKIETANTFLRELVISECRDLKFLNLSPTIKELSIGSCPSLAKLNLQNCIHLQKLVISDCTNLQELDFSQLKNLEELEITGCDLNRFNLKNLPPNLRSLKIENATSKLIDFSQFTNLENLTLINFSTPKLDFKNCENLKSLMIDNFELIPSYDFSHLKSLEDLAINGRKAKISNLDLTGLNQLKKITLEGQFEIINLNNPELRSLATTANIKSINFNHCPKLRNVEIVSSSVTELKNIQSCKELRNVTFPSDNPDHILHNSFPKDAQVILTDPIIKEKKEIETTKQIEIQTEDLYLNLQNQNNPVSIFNLRGSRNTDKYTGKSTNPHKATGSFTATLFSNEEIKTNQYRVEIFDDIKVSSKNEVDFEPKPTSFGKMDKVQKKNIHEFDINLIGFYKKLAEKREDLVVGHLKGNNLEPNKFYPLPAHQALTLGLNDIYVNPKDGVDLFWNEDYQQYFIRLKPGKSAKQNIEVLYVYEKNPSYDAKITQFVTQDPQELLPKNLIKELKNIFPNHPELKFMLDSNLSPATKLKKLTDYCEQFSEEELDNKNKITTGLAALLAFIKQKKGVCRHRSEAFMVMARFLGIPVRIVVNEQHEFCEIHCLGADGKTLIWQRVDLGGGFRLDLTAPDVRQNIFEQIPENVVPRESAGSSMKNKPAIVPPKKKQKEEQPTAEPQTIQATTDSKKETKEEVREIATPQPIQPQIVPPKISPEEKYYQGFSALVETTEINSTDELFKHEINSPLILLSPKQSPFQISKIILQNVKDKDNFLYIHDAADFHRFLKPYQLKNGQRKQIVGPLAELIKKGGTLVVNWSNFSETEIASYKSILDRSPTLLGKPVTEDLQVIGLVEENSENCSAFSSRCKPFSLADEFFVVKESLKEEIKMEKTEAVESKSVNLFNRTDWRDHLLGKIIFKENEILLEDGPLIKAIEAGHQAFIINNPPVNDPEFETLLNRITSQRRFLYNGALIKVPEHFAINTQNIQEKIELPNVRVSKEFKGERTRIYLDINNWHECFERLKISGGKAFSEDGFLKMYDPKEHVFYITGSIPYSDWQILLDYIRKNFTADKDLQFILAPGASIERVLENKTPPEVKTLSPHEALASASTCIKTNDPDYFSELLHAKHPNSLRIYTTPTTSLNQLLFDMQIVAKESDPSKVDFLDKPQGMLTALQNEQTVILTGDISPTLYRQLLPIISNEPGYIYLNGEQIKITGKLILVLPESSKLRPLQTVATSLNWEHYEFKQKDIFQNLKTFSELAKKYPVRGMGRPEISQFTHERLSRMITAIEKRQLHPHNPIKGLFHYDYPKDSDDYAYLNVVAKYLFCAQDNIPVRGEKLEQLLKHLNIKTLSDLNEHAWQILNCFRGAELQAILGPNINQAITMNRGYPSVDTDVQKRLAEKIAPFLPSEKKEKIIPRADASVEKKKQEQQLGILLADQNTSIILLKGPPGVGKTVTVRALKEKLNFDYYEGEDGILEWLNPADKTKVLLLDEANLAAPGTWDFLKGLSQDHKSVFYKGQFYPLSDKHKIIATGNPESFPGRHYHPFFQNYAETILFKKPSDPYLETILLKGLLEPENLFNPEYCKKLFAAYKLIQEHNPSFVYSIRDLENLSQRFITLAKLNPHEQIDKVLWQACMGEFAGAIFDVEQRQVFKTQLSQTLGYAEKLEDQQKMDGMVQLSPTYFLPAEKTYILNGIEQDLLLRNRMISHAEQVKKEIYYKQGVLIEGDPGVGKSRMLKEILEKNGFTKNNSDTQKKYYEISAGPSKVVADKLLKAFHEGAVVILDEINLDKSLEKLLNDLLTGKVAGKSAKLPGFMVFSSQNPASFKGRKSMSPALRNRLHAFYIEPYSNKALIDMARAHQIEDPEGFVKAYLRRAQHSKRPANMRTFFTLLEKESKVINAIQAKVASTK